MRDQSPTNTIQVTLTTGERGEFTLIGRVLRFTARTPSYSMLQYWPVEWVNLRSYYGSRQLTGIKRAALFLLILIELTLLYGVAAMLKDVNHPLLDRPNGIWITVVYCGTLTGLAVLATRLYSKWSAACVVIQVILAGQLTPTTRLSLVAPEEDSREWQFLERLQAFRDNPTDLTYNDFIVPYITVHDTCLGSLLKLRAREYLVVTLVGLNTGILLFILDNYPRGGNLLSEKLALVGMPVGALLAIVSYTRQHWWPFDGLRRKNPACERAWRALQRLEVETARNLILATPGYRDIESAHHLLIQASMMKGDLKESLSACAGLARVSPGEVEDMVAWVQSYRTLFQRMQMSDSADASPVQALLNLN